MNMSEGALAHREAPKGALKGTSRGVTAGPSDGSSRGSAASTSPTTAARPVGAVRAEMTGAGPAPAGPRRAAGRRTLARRLAKAVLLLAGLAFLAGLAGFLVFTTQIAAREPSSLKSADAIVVLTGGASRIADAVGLLSEGRGRRLLITGVNLQTTPAELRRALPDGERLIACCVDLGHRALNTRGNALEAAEWTRSQRFRSLVVVTSAWHMPRAILELGRALPDVELVSYPVVTTRMQAEQWWRDPSTLKLLFKEYLKYLMARVKIRPAQAVMAPEHMAAARTAAEAAR